MHQMASSRISFFPPDINNNETGPVIQRDYLAAAPGQGRRGCVPESEVVRTNCGFHRGCCGGQYVMAVLTKSGDAIDANAMLDPLHSRRMYHVSDANFERAVGADGTRGKSGGFHDLQSPE